MLIRIWYWHLVSNSQGADKATESEGAFCWTEMIFIAKLYSYGVWGLKFKRGHIGLYFCCLYERVKLGSVNTMNHYRCETSLLPKLFRRIQCPKVSFSRNLCVGPVLYISCQEQGNPWHAMFHTRIILPCHFALKQLQHVGHMYLSDIRIVLWVSGSTGVTHFRPLIIVNCASSRHCNSWYS